MSIQGTISIQETNVTQKKNQKFDKKNDAEILYNKNKSVCKF